MFGPVLSVFSCGGARSNARTSTLFWFISPAANPTGFLWKQLIHSSRCQELEDSIFFFSPLFNDAQLTIRFVTVWLVVFAAFLRSLDHLDLSGAVAPPISPTLPVKLLVDGRRSRVTRFISGQNKQTFSCTFPAY